MRRLLWLLAICALPLGAQAEEGMWPFNMAPVEQVKRDHGVTLTDAWLQRAQRASVRFNNGGSGSFVSPYGLVMTNHHVGADCTLRT
ncbi:MAG: S46 family peptidase, partial [Myxococcales bacterium]|nr:S46 family peptidase [Myxococcales bacterium]